MPGASPGSNAVATKCGWMWRQVELAATTPDEKVLLIDDALEKLQTRDPEKAKVVVLKFFGGLTNQQVAESMAVTERTIERHWAYAKAWLFQSIRTQQ